MTGGVPMDELTDEVVLVACYSGARKLGLTELPTDERGIWELWKHTPAKFRQTFRRTYRTSEFPVFFREIMGKPMTSRQRFDAWMRPVDRDYKGGRNE